MIFSFAALNNAIATGPKLQEMLKLSQLNPLAVYRCLNGTVQEYKSWLKIVQEMGLTNK
jgi:hypothetical protein